MNLNSPASPKHLIICGPTCSGKSALALRIAQKIGAVIINADSQQVYRELPILSAQPTSEEKELAPHLLYGVMSGAELCTVAKWLEMVIEAINEQSQPIIFCGGTGLYFQALMNGISPIPNIPDEIRRNVRDMEISKVAELLGNEADGNNQRMRRALEVKLHTGRNIKEWHRKNTKHPYQPEDFRIFHVNVSRETVYEKINSRLTQQIQGGALEEVKDLVRMNLNPELPIMKAHGVPEFKKYFEGEMSLEDAVSKAQQNVRNYAKRQMTWFRNQMPEHKIDILPEISDKELAGLV